MWPKGWGEYWISYRCGQQRSIAVNTSRRKGKFSLHLRRIFGKRWSVLFSWRASKTMAKSCGRSLVGRSCTSCDRVFEWFGISVLNIICSTKVEENENIHLGRYLMGVSFRRRFYISCINNEQWFFCPLISLNKGHRKGSIGPNYSLSELLQLWQQKVLNRWNRRSSCTLCDYMFDRLSISVLRSDSVVCLWNNGFALGTHYILSSWSWNATVDENTVCLVYAGTRHPTFPRRSKIRRHRRPCVYYNNTMAAFRVLLVGDLVFKLNPGPIVSVRRNYRPSRSKPEHPLCTAWHCLKHCRQE